MAFRFNFQSEDDQEQPEEPECKKICQEPQLQQAQEVCAVSVKPTAHPRQVPLQAAVTEVEFTPQIFAEKLLLYRGCVKPDQGALAEATAVSDLVPHGEGCWYTFWSAHYSV